MEGLALLLAYEKTDGSEAIRLHKVGSRDLLVLAARTAIRERWTQVDGYGLVDKDLGVVGRQEAKRLEQILTGLIPELRQQ